MFIIGYKDSEWGFFLFFTFLGIFLIFYEEHVEVDKNYDQKK